MGRTPIDKELNHGEIQFHPHEPDDHGGGFPAVEISTTIYNERDLNQAIRALEKCRKWIAWESEGKYKRMGKRKPKHTHNGHNNTQKEYLFKKENTNEYK